MLRDQVPFFDERFQGYGYDLVSSQSTLSAFAVVAICGVAAATGACYHCCRCDVPPPLSPCLQLVHYVVMRRWGVRFSVHPRAYLVHLPHAAPRALEATQRLAQGPKVSALPMVGRAGHHCGARLPRRFPA